MATAKTEILTILEVDALTGETKERPLNADEVKQLKEDQAQAQAQRAEQEAKEAARASALTKLAELGLTEEEIAAL
jgi:hypothetical protein